jgi:hypothetical protein
MGRVGGIVSVQSDGEIYKAKGKFSFNLGENKREPVIGQDGHHGFKEIPQAAFVEGSITDDGSVDLKSLVTGTGKTITLELANGKNFSLKNAYFAEEGTGDSEEGEIPVKWFGDYGVEF